MSDDSIDAREAARMLTEAFAESKLSRAPSHRERIVGASLVTVIRVTLSRGKGVTGDPVRPVTRYYDPDTGRLLAETDPYATTADRERFEVAAGIEGDHYDDRLWRGSGA